jgi:hypothetical protein
MWKVLVAGAVRRLLFRGWGNRFDIHPMVPRLQRCDVPPPMSPRVVCVCHVGCVGVGRSVTSGNYFAAWRALERYVCVRV